MEEDFVFHQDLFFERLKNLVELSEVETRSASFSVLLTDLHGALTERRLRRRITWRSGSSAS